MPSSVRKKDLIEFLQAVDEDRTFEYFFKLPPERRAMVYELLFNSYPTLESPEQTPIATACRQLRQEALPDFYKICTFAMPTHPPKTAKFGRFLKRTPEWAIARIRHLFVPFVQGGPYRIYTGSWRVYMKRFRDVRTFQVTPQIWSGYTRRNGELYPVPASEGWRHWHEARKQEIRALLRDNLRRPCSEELGKEDFQSFCICLEQLHHR